MKRHSHPKMAYCKKAETHLRSMLLTWMEAHRELTWAEVVQCIAAILSDWSKYPVTEERQRDIT